MKLSSHLFLLQSQRLSHLLMLRLMQVDGTVVIVDVETNGIARKLRGHSRQIQSLR